MKKNFKHMTAACCALLSVCLCTGIYKAYAIEITSNYEINDAIFRAYESIDDWDQNPDDNWNDNPDGQYGQADKGDDLLHKPFTMEVPEGYTPIRSIDELHGINNNPNGKYILMNDIDMTQETSPGGSWDTGHGWTPLDKFSGTFDGNGYRIIGMHIYGDLEDLGREVGLFSELGEGGTVRNLGMVACDINVKTAFYYSYDTWFDIGGIAGNAEGERMGKGAISGCYVDGRIQASGRGYTVFIAGGIVGSGNVTSDCCNMAEITIKDSSADKNRIGGIAGGGIAQRCYNTGKINVPASTQYVGAITGNDGNYSDSSSNYFLKGSVSAGDGYSENDYYRLCKALTDAQMKHASSFTGFNINGSLSERTWMVDELSAYPYPQLCSCPQVRVKKLEIAKYPEKMTYSQGDVLDLSGGILSITYEDGVTTSTRITPDMVSGIDMDKAAAQTAVVTYLNADCTFDLTVDEMKASGISLSQKKCSLARNKKMKLDAVITPSNVTDKSVQWTSDNEVVATVTAQGVVRGINAGTARITATTGNGLSASCEVIVTVPAKSISLNKTALTLKKGTQKKLKATLNPIETTDQIKWSSSDPGIASVNNDGLVKGKRKGYATIMAKTSSGKCAYVKIIVI